MAFIGNSSSSQNFVPQVDYFSGDGSTVAFTLSRAVVSAYQVEAVVANVVQNPSDAFTVNGNVITFTSAPPAGVNNVYVRYAVLNTTLLQPGQGTVAADQIAAGAVVAAKLASGAAVANIGNRAIAGSQLPAGTVLQVVQGSTTTGVSMSSTTQTDTGLSASITPTSTTSKILVLVHQNGLVKSSGNAANDIGIYLYRDSSQISKVVAYAGYTGANGNIYGETVSTAYLDSPATTASVIYKTKFNNPDGGASGGTVDVQNGASQSTITLMEIAA